MCAAGFCFGRKCAGFCSVFVIKSLCGLMSRRFVCEGNCVWMCRLVFCVEGGGRCEEQWCPVQSLVFQSIFLSLFSFPNFCICFQHSWVVWGHLFACITFMISHYIIFMFQIFRTYFRFFFIFFVHCIKIVILNRTIMIATFTVAILFFNDIVNIFIIYSYYLELLQPLLLVYVAVVFLVFWIICVN